MNSQKYEYLVSQSKRAAKAITNCVNRPGKTWKDWMRLIRAVTYNPKAIIEYQKSIHSWESKREISKFDEDRLESIVISEMNNTLSSGKITRISAMDIQHMEKQYPSEWYNWNKIIPEIFKGALEYPKHGAITGLEGSGKTYFAVWLMSILSGFHLCSNITVTQSKNGERYKFNYHRTRKMSEVLEYAEKEEQPTILFLDESGINWSQSDVQKRRNKTMEKIVRVMRKKRISFILIDQLWRTLPRDIKERNPIMFEMYKRNIRIRSDAFTGNIDKITNSKLKFDTYELPHFEIDTNIDELLKVS